MYYINQNAQRSNENQTQMVKILKIHNKFYYIFSKLYLNYEKLLFGKSIEVFHQNKFSTINLLKFLFQENERTERDTCAFADFVFSLTISFIKSARSR